MTQKIFDIKKKLLDEFDAEIERAGSIRNISTDEAGKVVDMIKDLAEAEEKCWKACYYKTVVEAMEEESGRRPMGYTPTMGRQGYQEAMGYNRGNMGYTGRMSGSSGYSDQSIQNIKQMMDAADPQRKEQLKQDLQRLLNEAGM